MSCYTDENFLGNTVEDSIHQLIDFIKSLHTVIFNIIIILHTIIDVCGF